MQFWQCILQFHGVFIIVPVSIPMHRFTFWTSIIPTKLRISKMGSTCVSSTQHFNTLPILQILQKSIYDTKINIKQWCSCQGIMISSDVRILTQRCPHFFASYYGSSIIWIKPWSSLINVTVQFLINSEWTYCIIRKRFRRRTFCRY